MSDDALMRWEWEGGASTSAREERKPAARVNTGRADKAATNLQKEIRAKTPVRSPSRDGERER